MKAAWKRMLKDQQGGQWKARAQHRGRREKGTPKKRRGESGALETRYRLNREASTGDSPGGLFHASSQSGLALRGTGHGPFDPFL